MDKTLTLWRVVKPFLPENLQSLRVQRCTIKFRLTARGGTKAEAQIRYAEERESCWVTLQKSASVPNPYALYRALEEALSIPDGACSLDLIINPNGVPKIKCTFIPTVKEAGQGE